MENGKGVSTNLLIFLCFIFLFIMFILIKPTTTGLITLPIIGETSDLSNPALIGAIVLLLVIWIAAIVLYRKLKNKTKLQKIEITEVPDPISSIEIPTPQEIQRKEGLTEEELKRLFQEIAPHIESIQQPGSSKKEFEILEKGLKKPELPTPEEAKHNLNELRKLLIVLLRKNYKKDIIVKYLQKKSWRLNEISQVINEINERSLRNYIKDALSLGYKKEQFIKLLLNKGWTIEDINKGSQ